MQVAADLVRYLTSEAVQKQRALTGSYAPTIMRLYDDPEILATHPFFAKLRPILENAVLRPVVQTGDNYMAVTTYFQKVGDPADLAPSMAVGFTINHIAAVFLPAIGGYFWIVDYRIPFIAGAVMALISLTAVQQIKTATTPLA